ncbi:MAG TPA: hypothetical protein VGN17_28285 [Bryobacteraceae bacterium]
MPSQQVSSAETESRLRKLEAEKEWTQQQHRLWSQERIAMMKELKDLRATVKTLTRRDQVYQAESRVLKWWDAKRGRHPR